MSKKESAFCISDISTNHAININGDLDIRRQFKIGFSNYYNKNRTPATEFGYVLFSQEWPKEQWNYFYIICAHAVQAYLKFGKREAPGQNLKLRELRQQMGEEFYQWAELYFSDPLNLNTLLIKTDLYNYFKERVSLNVIKYYTPTRFKRCVKAFCEYKGYLFNPEHKGEDNKSNGTEYITIGTRNKEENG